MKTIICYYSHSGKTKAIAEAVAKSSSAELFEIIEEKKRNFFTTWISGIFSARSGKEPKIKPSTFSLKGVERIILMAPIWAGYNAPAMNSFIQEIGSKLRGKQVIAAMTSLSGASKARKNIETPVVKFGAQFKGYLDLPAKDITTATQVMNDFLAKFDASSKPN